LSKQGGIFLFKKRRGQNSVVGGGQFCVDIPSGAGLSEFSIESINDPHVRRLFDKIQIVRDPTFESRDSIREAGVEVVSTDDAVLTNEVLLPRGRTEEFCRHRTD